MDDPSSTQSFHNLHHHHLPSYHLALPSLESPEVGYLHSQHTLDPLEQYRGRDGESNPPFATTNTSSGGKRGSSGAERIVLNESGGSLDGHANLGGHFDDESVRGGHFADTLYSVSKEEEIWEERKSCESTSDHFYGKEDCYSHTNDVFYPSNCGGEANYGNYGSCVAKCETAHYREVSVGRLIKQTSSYDKSAARGISDGCINDCRTDSMLNNDYLEREEDYGSSCGSGEDQQQPADVEGPWLSVSPSSQTGEGRWRGQADTITLASGCLSQKSPIGISSEMHIEKLDSFSEAFLSQHKRRFPLILSRDSSQHIWEFGERRGERHSCAFDSDSYLPPSSSSSPAPPSLPSFPSPPTSSHLMSSVLSPPPTPLPPPSLSPLKMDSPVTFGGSGHSLSQVGEPVQIFASRLQSFPTINSSGMIWKFPVLSRCFPQSCGDPIDMEGTLGSSHGREYSNITASNIPQSPDSTFPPSSSSTDRSPLHPVRNLCPSNAAPLHSPFHVASRPSHLASQHNEGAEVMNLHMADQKIKNGPTIPNQLKQQASKTYTGTPFPSILHSSKGQKRSRYTPRPLLNPVRTGKGLYSCLSSLHHREEKTACQEEDKDCGVLPYVNIGKDSQADILPCSDGNKSEEESPREELLWKPWGELKESTGIQDQVEKLLSMCSSSCLPGGGSNTELALHCLHHCQGDIKATLEMLLFSQPIPLGDYHYSGSDLWTDSEKSVFSAALGTHGKDFSRIQKLVKTKTVRQCVEFYYLSKRLLDKQKKHKEEESRDGESELQKSITPICQPVDRQFGLEEAVPVPSLASFFPCKLCGKMFYKIKSRNAHMKIHRQPQEDWTDRQLQQQILTQRLAHNRPNNLMPTMSRDLLQSQAPALTFDPNSRNNTENTHHSSVSSNTVTHSHAGILNPSTIVTYSNITASNSHNITNTNDSDSNQRQPISVLPFHQSWGSYGHSASPATFYYSSEGKDNAAAGTVVGKQPTNWQ
ncbi:uncharacterized protein si:dkey-19b23.10 [Notolabrus celidotus]|uniref:uncharacterized protein si:dkey-19b23.10 n=1 Tax=Notolabrus celidotus TaxID=1203425 RepID=UPI0014907CDF|nr:uncharacterized protein si:dkey-19b23.10 [Notolabrus celidotus]XP_034533025.1 uncharacterized protein si:dkey-19b23.10 [Notolabrus celidotus]XP_034533026.1 uncharacterized protein si:dkey-19b23.10 [Notolabrus celidotus]